MGFALATMKLKHKTEPDFLTHAMAIDGTSMIAVGDFWSVRLYSSEGVIGDALNIADDDLKIKAATKTTISGTCIKNSAMANFELDVNSVIGFC
jgi:uncharacterized Zn ribbon protein